MLDFLQRGIVRLFRPDGTPHGKTLGTGFIVHQEGLVATCAHVLEEEPGVSDGSRSVWIEFRATRKTGTAKVLTKFWRGQNYEDVAILQLVEQEFIDIFATEPQVAKPNDEEPLQPVILPLGFSAHLGGASSAEPRRLRTFGYPRSKNNDGLPGICSVVGTTEENNFEVFAVSSGEVSYGFSGAPVWDDELAAVVGVNVSIVKPGSDLAGRQSEVAFFTPIETYRKVCSKLALPPGQPYRNLDAFEEEHSATYFGREAASAQLVEKVIQNHFVAVIGFSGSGKSSLVRAGLIKGLSVAGSNLLDRPRIRFFAGATPLLSLITALNRLAPPNGANIFKLLGMLDAGDRSQIVESIRNRSVAQIAAGLREFARWQPMILICDQFERLYTGAAEAGVRERFISVLLSAASDDVKIIIAVRADYYYSRVLNEIGVATAVEDAEVILRSMKPEELHAAIEKPASTLFRHFQAGLADLMVREVSERAGDLPLLQFALTQLWAKDNEKGVLTLASYGELGLKEADGKVAVPGVRGAVIRRAEEYYLGLKTKEERERFRRLFRTLVSSKSASNNQSDISRRVLAGELDAESRVLADKLANTFLLTAGEDTLTQQRTYEVAHEALIRSWPRLGIWSQTEQMWNTWYQTALFPGFRQWLARTKNPDSLIRSESLLIEAHRWLSDEDHRLEGEIRDYVNLSIAQDQEQKSKASKLEELSGRRHRQLKQGSAAVVLIVIITAIFLRQAQLQERIVTARDLHQRGLLALQAHENLEAQLYFAKALTLDDRLETRERLIETLARGTRLDLVGRFDGDAVGMNATAGRVLVASSIVRHRDSAPQASVQLITDFVNPSTTVGQFSDYPGLILRGALSEDGQWIAWETHLEADAINGQGASNFLHLQNMLTGKESKYEVGDRPVSALVFSPDSDLLAFATERGIIRLIDLPNLHERAPLQGHHAPVWGLAISRGNKHLASCGTNIELRLWNLVDGTQIQLKGHTDVVYCVAFSPDGRTLASGSTDSTIRMWDVTSANSAPRIFVGDQGQFNCLAFSPDGRLLAGGAEDRTVRVWDVNAANELQKLPVMEGDVRLIAFSPAGDAVTATGPDGWLRRWRLDDGIVVRRIRNGDAPATAVAFGGEGRTLFATGQDGIVRQWSWPNPGEPTNLCSAGRRINCLAVNQIFQLIAWASEDNRVHIYDYSTGKEVQMLDFLRPDLEGTQFQQIWSIAFSQNGRRLACANFDRTIQVFERSAENSEFRKIQILPQAGGAVFGVAFSKDSSVLASGGGNKMVCLWKVGAPPKPRVLANQLGEVWGIAFSPDGTKLATGATDREIRIWDLQADAKPLVLLGHTALVNALAYSPGGRWLASGANDQTARLWNLSSGSSLTLRGATGPVWWVTFNPDGQFLAVAGLDGNLRIWSMAGIESMLQNEPAKLLTECMQRVGQEFDKHGHLAMIQTKRR